MYKIQGADQRQYGPVTADIVRQWIAQGRILGATLIQAEGTTDWRPASQFPEFADAFGSAPGPSPTATPPPPPPRPAAPIPAAAPMQAQSGKTSGMAIASLVLAILTLPTCGIGGVVGIILGIVSLVKISNSQGQLRGKGLAISGICVAGFFLLIAPGMLLPSLAKAKGKAQRIQCVNQMKQIALANRMWANDHGGKFPPDLGAISNELSQASLLVCPGDTKRNRNQYNDWSAVTRYGSSYFFSGATADERRPNDVLLRCPIHNNVALADGSVQQQGPLPRRW